MKRIALVIGATLYVIGLSYLGAYMATAQTPTPAQCGAQVSGMPNVLQFSSNNCLAVPPGPTVGTCWLAVVGGVLTFQCADGVTQKVSLTTFP